jgi:hypothetical protein
MAVSYPVEVDGEVEFKIDRILNHKGEGERRKYLVSWEGYPAAEAIWEPREHVEETEAL